MVRRFSRDPRLIFDLRAWAVDRQAATAVVAAVCHEFDSPIPEMTFHGRRGPHTGYYRSPRWKAVETVGELRIRRWEEDTGRPWPPAGMIRLGDPTSLGTVAHELGHHLAHHHEPVGTPEHGKRWVGWFDIAADGIAAWLSSVGKEI